MPLRRRLLPLAALLAVAPPAAAQGPPAALPVTSVDVLAREVQPGDVDGILEPGDTIELVQRLRNAASGNVRSLSGRLTSVRSDVALPQPTSPFPDLMGLNAEAANTATPFRLRLPSAPAMRCGGRADVSIALRDGLGRTTTVGHTIETGAPGTPQEFATGDDLVIPADGTLVESAIAVPADLRSAKAVRVRIDRLTHAHVRDLALTLVAPSGTEAPLVAASPSTDGADFVGTWLEAGGPPLSTGSAPWTDTFGAPALEDLGGETFTGQWRLRVRTTVATAGVTGLLDGWRVQLAPATCAPLVAARISRQPSIGRPGGKVTLDAGASTPGPGATIVSRKWDLDGDDVFETTAEEVEVTAPHPTLSSMKAVALEVRDSLHRVDTEELLIPFTDPPTARLAPVPEEDTGTPLTFDASASDDEDGDSIVEFRWNLDGNDTFERTSDASPLLAWTFDRPGLWPVAVEVTDGYGETGTASRFVAARNRPPVAAVTAPAWVPLGEPFTLDASGSDDPDGDVVAYDWDLDGNGACDDRRTTTPTTTATLTESRVLGVCVTDDATATSARGTRAVGVTRRPVAVITAAATVKPGAPLALSAAASTDPDGDAIVAWAWDLDADGTYETPGVTATRSWPLEGPRTVGLQVTDARDPPGVATAQVTVVNPPPVAALVLTPPVALRGTPVVLDARGSTDDAGVTGYAFDLDGDGTYETSAPSGVASRAYPNAGSVGVGVRVIDAGGKTATRRATLTITAPAAAGGAAPTTDAGGGRTPLPPAGTGTGTSPGSGPGAGAGAASLAAALTAPAVQRLRDVLARGLALRCTADRAVTCALTATVTPATARRLGLARAPRTEVVVGTATARGGALRLRLRPAAAARLRRARSVLVTVRGTARDARGGTARLARAVTLRR